MPHLWARGSGVQQRQQALDRQKSGELGVRFGAVLLACLVWLYAATEMTYRAELDIRLQVADPPPARDGTPIVVANPVPEWVSVVVSGRGKDILLLEEDAFLLRVKPPVGRPGVRRKFRLVPEQVVSKTELPVRVEEIVAPKEVEVVLDKLVEANLPVRAQTDVQVAESYIQVGPVEVTPGTILVSGPASLVRALYVLHTDSLAQSGVRRDIAARLPLLLPEGTRLEMSSDHVTVSGRRPGAGRVRHRQRPGENTRGRGFLPGCQAVARHRPRAGEAPTSSAGWIRNRKSISSPTSRAGPGWRERRFRIAPGPARNFEIREITPEFVTLVRR